MIDAAVFYCNKDLKLHCEREQKLQRVPTALSVNLLDLVLDLLSCKK